MRFSVFFLFFFDSLFRCAIYSLNDQTFTVDLDSKPQLQLICMKKLDYILNLASISRPQEANKSVYQINPFFFIVLNNRYILQDFTSKSRDQNVILVIFPFLYTFRRVGFVKETASAPANRFVYSSIEATHCKHDRARAHVRS